MTTDWRVTFPDIVMLATTAIRAKVDAHGTGTPAVGAAVPNPRPDSFVRVRRTGGPRADLATDHPLVTVEAWALDEPTAMTLAESCRFALYGLRDSTASGYQVYRVEEVAGPAFLPDPDSPHARVVFTTQLRTRGVPAIVE